MCILFSRRLDVFTHKYVAFFFIIYCALFLRQCSAEIGYAEVRCLVSMLAITECESLSLGSLEHAECDRTADGFTSVFDLDRAECGVSTALSHRQPRSANNSQGRIVNGKESRKGAWPWQVSLQVLHPKIGLIAHWCGGVLIQPSWILTAAHCIHNDIFSLPMPALWTVVIGDWDRSVDEKNEQRIPVENIFVHESFNNYNNDIALLQLSRPISNHSQQVVCLDGLRSPPRLCIATGWGRASPAGPLSATLRQVRVPILDNSICRDKYKPVVTIESGHLCAGKLDGSTGACVGDSGGPLQCSRKDGRWFLAGITSFGFGCAKPGFPDVYTRLSHYLPWIQRKIRKHSHND